MLFSFLVIDIGKITIIKLIKRVKAYNFVVLFFVFEENYDL